MKNSNNSLPWNDYASFIKSKFGARVQKISVNAGLTCPNRDGKINSTGCIYCINESFSPFYCNSITSITEQLNKGISFFSAKYQSQKYFAYFQSFTNTYSDVNKLERIFTEALNVNNIIGLVIATRPDCISPEILKMLKKISGNKFILIELGAESTKDKSLDFINRGHNFKEVENAVFLINEYNFLVGLHLIIGLPHENEKDFYDHANIISKLPINTLKLHQLQILKGTIIEKVYKENPEIFIDMTIEKYISILIHFLELLNPNIILDRFTSESPKNMIIAPDWQGKKNFEISNILAKEMLKNRTFQGRLFNQQ